MKGVDMNGPRALVRTMNVAPTRWGAIARSVLVVVTMALLGAMLVSTVDAAPKTTNIPMDDRISGFRDECRLFGGKPSTHYDFGLDGEVASARSSCEGGATNGWTCTETPTTYDCSRPLIAPTESVLPQQRPDTAESLENPQETPPVVDDNAVPPGGVAEDPTGEEQARIVDPAEACRALGGTANVIGQGPRVPAEIRCTGGTLDDMICYGTICDYFRGSTGSEEAPNAPPSGGIEFVQVDSMAELEDALLAEDPTGSDTVVVYNQSGSTMTDNATNLVLACEALGGTVRVTEERTVGSGLKSIFVRCTGGLLGGLGCGYLPGYSACFFRAVLPEDLRVTPAAGIEVPAEDAPEMPAVAPTPTEVPVTPTVPPPTPSPTAVPTIELVEATAVPTKTLPDPKNDNAAPPGNEAEDPTENEPVPTEAPLR